MKIGIMTFHRANNFGAVLQAYALQESIISLGTECEIIDYRNPMMEKQYGIKTFKGYKSLKHFILLKLYSSQREKTIKSFKKFRDEYLKLSSKIYTDSKELETCIGYYDKFISGSDQVWNYTFLGFDKNYLFDFIPYKDKKYSYAASFGVADIPDGYVSEYKRLLLDYSFLSVRETQGCDIIKKICGIHAERHIDPVFLLTPKSWSERMKCSFKHKKYIFVFIYEITPSTIKFIEDLYNKTRYRIFITGKIKKKILNAPYKCIYGISPKEYVNYIKNAQYIVTDSFHGAAFSILFNKEFFVELLVNMSYVNSRIENILDMMNLNNRIINASSEVDKLLENKVDWDSVNKIINTQRQKALTYLKSIV